MKMEKFYNYLKDKQYASDKQIPYFINWVSSFLSCNEGLSIDQITDEHIKSYLDNLSRKRENWQVEQAREAIGLYRFFCSRNKERELQNMPDEAAWKHAANEMLKMLRLKHRSYSTEKTYLIWLRTFYKYIAPTAPQNLNEQHLKEFLTYLAVERRVSKSTQNQAFNALLFFYRHVIDVEVGSLAEVIRSRRGRRLPTVLMPEEVHSYWGTAASRRP